MCERDIVERLGNEGNYAECPGYGMVKDSECGNTALLREARAEILRLRSELADARRAGWIAGRDAAAEEVLRAINNETDDMDELLDDINALEPPA